MDLLCNLGKLASSYIEGAMTSAFRERVVRELGPPGAASTLAGRSEAASSAFTPGLVRQMLALRMCEATLRHVHCQCLVAWWSCAASLVLTLLRLGAWLPGAWRFLQFAF